MKAQRGMALMVMLLLAGVLAAFWGLRLLNAVSSERDQATAAALAQAKEALIGFAATYRDTHPKVDTNRDKLFGYLPCPDINNDGVADSPCGTKDVTVIGRLPWNTLGLMPLRDGANECLWYAVSGHVKDNPNTDEFNWDTLGQLQIAEAVTGTVLAAANQHNTPWAVVLAAHAPINGQNRSAPVGSPVSECGGNNVVATYLEGTDPIYSGTAPLANAVTTLTLSTPASAQNGTYNDQGLTITSAEVFERIKKRTDFSADVGTLLDKFSSELNALPSTSLSTGFATVMSGTACPVIAAAGNQKDDYVRCNWKNNLQYAAPATPLTLNGAPCNAVLFLAGARTSSQNRITSADKTNVGNYLEGGNAALFPASGAYTSGATFVSTNAGADLARCITGVVAGVTTQQSFAADLASFTLIGSGVTRNLSNQTVSIVAASGNAGACIWSGQKIPLAGKTLRAYYEFQLGLADTRALTGTGTDLGNGFTLQLVTGRYNTAPNTCGTEANMGALNATDSWGIDSIILETDVRRNAGQSDPTENHSAIMLNGQLSHTGTGDTLGTACNGSTTGCRHTPANKFEELPSPLPHNQRVEIHTGCNASCSVCNPANHVAPNTYARIRAWTDCPTCNDVSVDINPAINVPTLARCTLLDPLMNSIFFGFTCGFNSGQSMTLSNAVLRSQ